MGEHAQRQRGGVTSVATSLHFKLGTCLRHLKGTPLTRFGVSQAASDEPTTNFWITPKDFPQSNPPFPLCDLSRANVRTNPVVIPTRKSLSRYCAHQHVCLQLVSRIQACRSNGWL